MGIDKIAQTIIQAFKRKNFLYIIGNGGSSAMSTHFVGEMLGKFKKDRQPLPAISLFDLASMTAIANDYGYEYIFVRPLSALGRAGDVLLALSTSGKSQNVLKAIEWAKANELIVIDFEKVGDSVAEIQENQLVALHELAGMIEEAFL